MAPYQRQLAVSFDPRRERAGDAWIWSVKTTVDLQKYAGALGLSDSAYARRYRVRDNIGLLNVHQTPAFPAYAGVRKTSYPPRASSTSDPSHSRRQSYVAPKPVRPPIAYPPTPASQHASPMMTGSSYVALPPKASPYSAFQPYPPPAQVKREKPVAGDLSTYPRKLYECLEQSARIPPSHATNGQLAYHVYCRMESAYAGGSNEFLGGAFKDRHMANVRAAEAYIAEGYYESMRGTDVEYVVLPDGTLKISGHSDGSIGGEIEIFVKTTIMGRGEFTGMSWA